MLNIDPLYLVINLILLFIFASMGRFVAKGGSYKYSSSVCIIAFTLVLGARYMRGNDYEHYIDVFNHRTEADQHLFTWLNDFLTSVGINAYGAYFVYAFIFSTSLFFFLRHYKAYAAYIFPISLIALIFFHEYMIRQELSFSFIFLIADQLLNIEKTSNEIDNKDSKNAYRFKNDDDFIEEEQNTTPLQAERVEDNDITHSHSKMSITWKNITLCLIFITCAISIHTANLFVIIAILVFWLTMRSQTIPYYFSIPLILFGALFLNKFLNFDNIAPYISLLQGTDDKFDAYIEKSDYWFSKEGASEIYTRNSIIQFLELWGYGALLWISDRMSKQINFGPLFASTLNTIIIGSFVMMTFRELEIIHRMGYVLTTLWFLPLSICLYHMKDFVFNIREKVLLIGLVWWIYEYLKYLFLRNDGMTSFLWDMGTF